MAKITTHTVLPINEIKVKEDRLREDYGDVQDLAADIKRFGLLHPPTVDDGGWLLAGERRLRACRSLGWTEIPVKMYSALTDEEKLDIEVSENTKRKDLTGAELGKRLAQARRAEEVLGHAPITAPKGGRPTVGKASKARIAAKVGTSRRGLKRAEEHAAAIKRFPELADLSQRAALQEYAKRTAPPKKAKVEPAPKVVTVQEYKLDGATRGRIDVLIAEHGFLDYTSVLSSSVEHLLNSLTSAAVSEVPTSSKLAQPSAPVISYVGPRPCDVCKQAVPVKDRVKLKGRSGHRECVRKAA